MMLESAELNMPANLENSAGATGLEKVSFHSFPKERQYQKMIKLPMVFFTEQSFILKNQQGILMVDLFSGNFINSQFPSVWLLFKFLG